MAHVALWLVPLSRLRNKEVGTGRSTFVIIEDSLAGQSLSGQWNPCTCVVRALGHTRLASGMSGPENAGNSARMPS